MRESEADVLDALSSVLLASRMFGAFASYQWHNQAANEDGMWRMDTICPEQVGTIREQI